MSQMQVDSITNAAGTGGPSLPNGSIGVANSSLAAAGYIGEIIEVRTSGTSTVNYPGGNIFFPTNPLVLTPGDWLLMFEFTVDANGATFPANAPVGLYGLDNVNTDTSPTLGLGPSYFVFRDGSASTNQTKGGAGNLFLNIQVAAATTSTLYGKIRIDVASGTPLIKYLLSARRMR